MKKHIPNILTISRAISTIAIIILFFVDLEHKFHIIYILFLYGGLTDFLDGYFARKWKIQSTFGIVFDSLVDKIFILSFYMLLIPYDIIHNSIFVILLFREIFIDGLKNYMLSKKHSISSRMSGKIKLIFQIMMINFALLFLIFKQQYFLQELTLISSLLAILFAYYSAYFYIRDFHNFTKKINSLK